MKIKSIAQFPKPTNVGKRDWGEEILLALVPKKISLKRLIINKGSFGGLQYHHKKDECGILISGKLKIRYANNDGKLRTKTLKSGSTFYFPKGSIHQEIALTKCVIIEASTPYFNDRVRVEKIFGLKADFGLPSVRKKDVILK